MPTGYTSKGCGSNDLQKVMARLRPSLRTICESYGPEDNPTEGNPARALAGLIDRFDSLRGRELASERIEGVWTTVYRAVTVSGEPFQSIGEHVKTRRLGAYASAPGNGNGHSNGRGATWIEECRRIYKANLPNLMSRYPGKCVAISRTEIVDVGDLPELFRKYRDRDKPAVEFFFVPTSVSPVEGLKGPSGVLPEN